jgi:glycosyltransferase involved in cell wall biosynthesis
MRDNDAPLLLDVSRMVWRRWSGTRQTGIDRICLAWLEHYAPRAQAVIVHQRTKAILPERTSQALFRLLLRPERGRGDVADFRRRILALGLWQGRHLRDRLPGRGRVWLNPGHTGLDVDGLAEWCARRHLRAVYLVHDLIPITHPQFCREGEDERHRRRMRTMLATAAGIVANSAHTLEVYSDFAEAEGAAVSPAIVAWPGAPVLPPARGEAHAEPTFVVLGTIEGRKNHALLLSVWQQFLDNAVGGPAVRQVPKLVIVGRRGWRADHVFAMLDQHDFKGRVAEVGALDDARLAELLKGARALLFPSFAEGFGIPLIEALEAGVPVIASDLPVFREIGQGVPELLPVSDTAAWQAAIRDFAQADSPRRHAQIERLAGFRPPTWEEHFRRIDGLIASLQG